MVVNDAAQAGGEFNACIQALYPWLTLRDVEHFRTACEDFGRRVWGADKAPSRFNLVLADLHAAGSASAEAECSKSMGQNRNRSAQAGRCAKVRMG